MKYARCFHYLEISQKVIYTLEQERAVNTLKGAENVTCAIHCHTVVSMALDRTQGSGVAVPLTQTSCNLPKVFNLISLLKSVAFAFIHIQQVINLKKVKESFISSCLQTPFVLL